MKNITTIGVMTFYKDWNDFFKKAVKKTYIGNSTNSFNGSILYLYNQITSWSNSYFKLPINNEGPLKIETFAEVDNFIYTNYMSNVDSVIYDIVESRMYFLDSNRFIVNVDKNDIEFPVYLGQAPMWLTVSEGEFYNFKIDAVKCFSLSKHFKDMRPKEDTNDREEE